MCGVTLPSSIDSFASFTARLKPVFTDFTGRPLNSTKCVLMIPSRYHRRMCASMRAGTGTGG